MTLYFLVFFWTLLAIGFIYALLNGMSVILQHLSRISGPLRRPCFRPVTPDPSSNSVQSNPNEKDHLFPLANGSFKLQWPLNSEYRLQETLGPSVLKRASMALDDAIGEIEDQVEDEIALPCSVPTAEVVRPFLTVNYKKPQLQ
jgi:hypothetical protein